MSQNSLNQSQAKPYQPAKQTPATVKKEARDCARPHIIKSNYSFATH